MSSNNNARTAEEEKQEIDEEKGGEEDSDVKVPAAKSRATAVAAADISRISEENRAKDADDLQAKVASGSGAAAASAKTLESTVTPMKDSRYGKFDPDDKDQFYSGTAVTVEEVSDHIYDYSVKVDEVSDLPDYEARAALVENEHLNDMTPIHSGSKNSKSNNTGSFDSKKEAREQQRAFNNFLDSDDIEHQEALVPFAAALLVSDDHEELFEASMLEQGTDPSFPDMDPTSQLSGPSTQPTVPTTQPTASSKQASGTLMQDTGSSFSRNLLMGVLGILGVGAGVGVVGWLSVA